MRGKKSGFSLVVDRKVGHDRFQGVLGTVQYHRGSAGFGLVGASVCTTLRCQMWLLCVGGDRGRP